MTDRPVIHLWNPIVGAECLSTFGEGDVHVHVPVSLATGVAAECGVADACMFVELIVRAALSHISSTTECPDLYDDIAPVVERLGWHTDAALEVGMRAHLDPGASSVTVVAVESIQPVDLPGFAGFEPQPGWSGVTENLWTPHRFADELPMVVTARAGGRPGWSISKGLDIAGAERRYDQFHSSSFDGWPQVVLQSATQVVRLDAEWDLRNRAAGDVIVVNLRPTAELRKADRWAPEWKVGEAPTVEASVTPEDDEDDLFDEPRLMVSAGEFLLHQIGDDRWSVTGPETDARFDTLMDAINEFEAYIEWTTRIEYHDGLDDMKNELTAFGKVRLFVDSQDGLWHIGHDLWVPALAEEQCDDVFESIGVYGDRGYYVYLYRWQGNYLFTYDENSESRRVGWEVLGRMSHDDAVEYAESYASDLDEETTMLNHLNDPAFVAELRASGVSDATIASMRASIEWNLSGDDDD